MREVRLPPSSMPPLARSVVASLAAILELDPDEIPQPAARHPEPWTVWRNWLSQRGLGLVPVEHPSTFGWPGPWVALLAGPAADADPAAVDRAAVAFGVPPGIIWDPLGHGADGAPAARMADVLGGFVVAPADPALWVPRGFGAPLRVGRVEVLAIAAEAEAPMVVLEEVAALAGYGLEGDRYGAGRGTFSNPNAVGVDLTLVEAEAIGALGLIAPQDARRNVVTRGIELNALVGERFMVGEVYCIGRRLCEPCAHLQKLTVAGTLRGLVHRGGLRADVISDGTIRVGDEVRAA
jgi:MOSC domain-containing protein YiiM